MKKAGRGVRARVPTEIDGGTSGAGKIAIAPPILYTSTQSYPEKASVRAGLRSNQAVKQRVLLIKVLSEDSRD